MVSTSTHRWASRYFSPPANQVGAEHASWPAVSLAELPAGFVGPVPGDRWLTQSALLRLDTEPGASRAHPEPGAPSGNGSGTERSPLSIAAAEATPTAPDAGSRKPE